MLNKTKTKTKTADVDTPICIHDKEFHEILTSRVTNLNSSVFQIRVTDSLTLFKIDSSTNELPLTEIDFSINPSTPESQDTCSAHPKSISPADRLQKRQSQLLTMRRMESGDEPDFVQKLRVCRKISPLATNERPLTCNCSFHLPSVIEDVVYPHNHSKSETDINEVLPYASKNSSPPLPMPSTRNSFEEEFLLSSSAPAALMTTKFQMRIKSSTLKPSSASNSPTASTLQLCQALDETTTNLNLSTNLTRHKHVSNGRNFRPIKQCLPSAQSAPVIVDLANPFKFPGSYSFKQFAPIAENASTISTHNIDNNQTIDNKKNSNLHQSFTVPQQHFNAYHNSHHHDPNLYPMSHMQHDYYYHYPHLHLHHHYNNNNNMQIHHTPTINIPNVVVTFDKSPTSSSNLLNDMPLKTNNFDEFNTNITSTFGTTFSSPSTISTTIPQHCSQQPFNNPPHTRSSYSQTHFESFNKPVNNTNPSTFIKPTIADTTTDNTVTSTSSSSSVSSRRQRHSIAGQMSYMKMLGFGGFSKKMTTSSNSLFSTAVITGSSSAPNLRDMIPVSSSVLDGFGGVPPIRPLETLHNALSLKQLDHFLEKMTSAPLFKTPTCTPPKNPSTPLSMMTTATMEEEPLASTPTNQICQCNDSGINNENNTVRCSVCGHTLRTAALPEIYSSTPVTLAIEGHAITTSITESGPPLLWSKQSSIASSITEPSSPAISDTCSQETPSCDMSISLTSTEGYNMPTTAAQRLAKFFPRLDDDLNSVSVYAPINMDCLESTEMELSCAGATGGYDAKSACLTPVSFNMDLSVVANKGSLTLSVDGFEDDDDATPSAATTPSLPRDEPNLEFCYCCETHSSQGQPPDDNQKSNELFNIMRNKRLAANESKQQCFCHEISPLSAGLCNIEAPTLSVRKASDTISPKIQKQISLFESGELERQKDHSALHASINIPHPSSLQLKQDARLRKFENLTQSTSNSNFPFESNTLKRVPNNVEDFVDMNLTQSCINLKTSGVGISNTSSTSSSPQHKTVPSVFRPATQSCSTMPPEELDTTSTPASPRPGALIVKAKFIEPPKRITRSFHGKTQSMDADFLFNEFLLVPTQSLTTQNSSSSNTGSAATSPSARSNKRFTTTKVLDEDFKN